MRRRDAAINPVERSHDAHEVDSLHRGLEIMRSFRPGESTLSCSEIALRMGLRRATTQRLLDTLVAHAGMMGTGIPGSLKMIRLRVRIPLPVPAALVLRGPEAAWMTRWLAANAFLR